MKTLAILVLFFIAAFGLMSVYWVMKPAMTVLLIAVIALVSYLLGLTHGHRSQKANSGHE